MKHKYSILILVYTLVFLFVLTSCGGSHTITVSQTVSYSDSDTVLTIDDFAAVKPVSEDEYYIYYKEIVDYKEHYSNISLTEVPDNIPGSFSAVSSDGKLYFSKENSVAGEMSASPVVSPDSAVMYEYDITSGKYREIIRTDLYHNGVVHTANDKYVIWESDENCAWYRNSLNVYDKVSGNTKEFYKFTRDTETDTSYVGASLTSNIELINDNVYFHDITGFYDNGDPIYKVFCYSIIDDKLDVMSSDARNATEYNGNVAWVNKSDDMFNSCLYSAVYEENVFKITSDRHYSLDSSKRLVAIAQSMNHYQFECVSNGMKYIQPDNADQIVIDTTTNYSLKAYNENETVPLMLSKESTNYIESPKSNGRFAGASIRCSAVGTESIVPVIYDSELDKLISFSLLTTDKCRYYRWEMCENYLYLIVESNNDSMSFVIDIKSMS